MNNIEAKIKELLEMYTDEIRSYMRESSNNIGFDERGSMEFVDIFLKKEGGNVFIAKELSNLVSKDEVIKKIKSIKQMINKNDTNSVSGGNYTLNILTGWLENK